MTAVVLNRRIVLLAGSAALLSTTARAGTMVESGLFGVIEIGASGVKPSVFRITTYANATSDLAMQAPLPDSNINPRVVENAPQVVTEVAKQIADLQKRGVSRSFILIAGSSGLGAAGTVVKEKVEAAINDPDSDHILKVILLDVETETRFTFDGIANQKNMSEARSIAVLVDIGSGNTKGGYMAGAAAISKTGTTAPKDFTYFSTDYGTKSFRETISKAMQPGEGFAAAARRVADTTLRDEIRKKLAEAALTELGNRKLFYLSGGIPWAVTTTQAASNDQDNVELTSAKLERFYNEATGDQTSLFDVNLANIDKEKQRTLIAADLDRLQGKQDKPVFTNEELISGAELLRVLSEEMKLAEKKVYFPRSARNAWVLGWAYEQLADGAKFYDTAIPLDHS